MNSAKRYRKRFVRYSLLSINLFVVALALFLVARQPDSGVVSRNLGSEEVNPLDTLSAADIAVNASRLVALPEQASVTNQADSVNAELTAPVGDTAVVALPVIPSSQIKTKSDIQEYVVQNGDTLGSLATKFGVTSDSIKWSNGLTTNNVRPGTKFVIPPREGIVYTVKSGDTPDSLASKYSANKDQIIVFNDAEVTGLKVGDRILIPDGKVSAPATSRTTSSYVATGFSFGSSAIYGYNGYTFGWCTWYAANRRIQLGNPVPANLGNAYSWYARAVRAGLPTGNVPRVGAVTVDEPGNHVTVVEQINGDGSFWVSEMNSSGQVSITDTRRAGGWNRLNYRLIPSVGRLKFIY